MRKSAGTRTMEAVVMACGILLATELGAATVTFATSLVTIGDLVLPLLCAERTRYGVGYSEHAFRNLQVGLTERDVINALGEPLSRNVVDDQTIFYYSEQATPTDDYFLRAVVFDAGHMVERYAEFYVD